MSVTVCRRDYEHQCRVSNVHARPVEHPAGWFRPFVWGWRLASKGDSVVIKRSYAGNPDHYCGLCLGTGADGNELCSACGGDGLCDACRIGARRSELDWGCPEMWYIAGPWSGQPSSLPE